MITETPAVAADRRAEMLQDWLQALDPVCGPATLLASDASFRRYFRARCGSRSRVVMDAPPEHEDTGPFLRVAGLLHALGLRAPRVLAADPDRGFVLLEDLGDQTFTRALAAGADERELYRLAWHTLEALQTRWPELGRGLPGGAELPAYDNDMLLREARLFIDWYWPETFNAPAPPDIRTDFDRCWLATLEALPPLPDTLVLRDFHVDNLMLLSGNGYTETGCGLLDFQDAVVGSPAYDLVSLLQDARRDVAPAIEREFLQAALSSGLWPQQAFLHHYRVLGVQRTVKIIGIFTRLARRDHKPAYLVHQPRLWRLLEQGLQAREVAPVSKWFHTHFRSDGQPCAR